jgi:hypothetical protein
MSALWGEPVSLIARFKLHPIQVVVPFFYNLPKRSPHP